VEGYWIDDEKRQILVQRLMNSRFKDVFKEIKYTREDSIFYAKFYVISYRENNFEYVWLGGMTKINEYFYLDLTPEECIRDGKEMYGGFNTSSIAKLSWENNNSMVLSFLNGDYIKEIISNGNARVRHEHDPLFGTFIITASSQELHQFLEKYGNDSRLLKGGNTVTLIRK
jgi:hypothetical protein